MWVRRSCFVSKLCSVANRPVASSPHNRLSSCQDTIFCRKLLGMSPEYLVKKLRPQHVAKLYSFEIRFMGLLLILHVYYLPLMSLNSHRRYMLVMLTSKFDNLCRDHVGVLNGRSMAIKLKIVDLHFLYARIVDRSVILPLNPLLLQISHPLSSL